MSETVMFTGIVKKVSNPDGLALEPLCYKICGDEPLPSWCSSYCELIREDDQFVIYNNELYMVDKLGEYDDSKDIFEGRPLGDGSIEFTVKYHNGGCGFGEAIQKVLDVVGGKK